MAQKVEVQLVDDLDGGEAAETLDFGLDGVFYEIDLSQEHADELRDALADYVSHARRQGRSGGGSRRRSSRPTGSTGSSRSSPSPGRTPIDREQNRAMREWARRQGMEVSDRGRIPNEVVEAYQRAGDS